MISTKCTHIFMLGFLLKCITNVNIDYNISLYDHFYQVYIDNTN